MAPDTCKCEQWENTWRDNRVGGGVPLFQKANGAPQLTGYTGYDCSTPICVQAERFRLYANLSGSTQGKITINTQGSEMATKNYKHDRSFQTGCGWDVLDTGCCFGANDGTAEFICFRCEKLLVSTHNATCAPGALKEWIFIDSSKVPLSFRASGDILMCGSNLDSERITALSVHDTIAISNRFLCNVWQWEQGDFIDDAGLSEESGIGSDFGLKPGRHIRVNYNNYYQIESFGKWHKGPEIQGEGIYECWNGGSCIAPDKCACNDGYGGFDCATPLCRHNTAIGEILGCINGICIAKDECKCFQQESELWKVHAKVERGLTGWTGPDCSTPICMQGYYVDNCNASVMSGDVGCYRCANGGMCLGPDMVSTKGMYQLDYVNISIHHHFVIVSMRRRLERLRL